MNERAEDLLRDFVARAAELLHTRNRNGVLGAVVALAEDLSAVPAGPGVLRCQSSLGVQGLKPGQEFRVSVAVTAVLETAESLVAPDPRQVSEDGVAENEGRGSGHLHALPLTRQQL